MVVLAESSGALQLAAAPVQECTSCSRLDGHCSIGARKLVSCLIQCVPCSPAQALGRARSCSLSCDVHRLAEQIKHLQLELSRYVVPHLTIGDLYTLRATCRTLHAVVQGASDEAWHAAALNTFAPHHPMCRAASVPGYLLRVQQRSATLAAGNTALSTVTVEGSLSPDILLLATAPVDDEPVRIVLLEVRRASQLPGKETLQSCLKRACAQVASLQPAATWDLPTRAIEGPGAWFWDDSSTYLALSWSSEWLRPASPKHAARQLECEPGFSSANRASASWTSTQASKRTSPSTATLLPATQAGRRAPCSLCLRTSGT